MSKLLRIAGFALTGVVLLLVAAAIILPLVVDPNDYKDEIAAAVQEKTGRTLTIQGDIGLSVFPWLGLQVGPVTLSNAKGFSDRPFANMDAVEVRIKLLPLLSKQVEMDTVVLRGLQLSLETDPQGKTNWDDLAGEAAPAQPAATEAEPTASPSATEVTLAGLAIGGVEITDAGILWDDRKTDARYQIEGLSLRTGAIAPGEAVPVELKLALDSTQPQIAGPVSFVATVALSDDGQVISLQGAELGADLSGEGLPGGQLQAALGFDTTLDLQAQTLELTDLVLKALGLEITGKLNGTQILGDANFNAELKILEFVPRDLIKALGEPLPEVSDAGVLGRADGDVQLKATLNSVDVSEFRFGLDDSTLKGNLKVTDFASPAIRFALQLDEIDVDRYLPPAKEPVAPVPPTAAAAAGAQMIPVDTLRALNVAGTLNIGKLKAAQLRSQDISMQLKAKDGVVRVYPAKASMYDGKYQGDIKLDVRGAQPKITMDERLTGVQVGPLLKDLTGKDTLSGTTRASAKLTTSGQTPEQFTKTLNGKVDFAFTDGAVKGFNLAAMLRKAQARLNGQPLPADKEPNQTDFSSLTGTASITNGVVRNRDLLAQSPLLRVSGAGDIDLPAEKLDYLVKAKIVGSLEGQGGKGLTDLKGVEIPVRLSGTFAEPKYKIELEQAVKQKAEKKIKKKLEKKFGDKFKGLFQ
ncbi:MAG TPA: AsmA family protein [Gammaproteobacteria bacterium]|nr:AsmA family protein [Gammaproteobacteria bacterium]